jgi:hypothetical protein
MLSLVDSTRDLECRSGIGLGRQFIHVGPLAIDIRRTFLNAVIGLTLNPDGSVSCYVRPERARWCRKGFPRGRKWDYRANIFSSIPFFRISICGLAYRNPAVAYNTYHSIAV